MSRRLVSLFLPTLAAALTVATVVWIDPTPPRALDGVARGRPATRERKSTTSCVPPELVNARQSEQENGTSHEDETLHADLQAQRFRVLASDDDDIVARQEELIEELEVRIQELEARIDELEPLARVTLVAQLREMPDVRTLSQEDRALLEYFVQSFGKLPQPWQLAPLVLVLRSNDQRWDAMREKYAGLDLSDPQVASEYREDASARLRAYHDGLAEVLTHEELIAFWRE